MNKYIKLLLSITLILFLTIANNTIIFAMNVYAETEKEFHQYIYEFTKGDYKELNIYYPKDKYDIDKYVTESSMGRNITRSDLGILSTHKNIEYYNNEVDNYYKLYYYNNIARTKVQKTETKANQIVAKIIKPKMTSQQKVTAIAKYLKKNVTYDYYATQRLDELTNNGTVMSDKDPFNEISDSFCAYGALYNGKCVCEGYAKAFMLLANKAEVPTIHVSNRIHAWNVYKIGNKYYEIDTTCGKDIKGRLIKSIPTFVEKNYYKTLFKRITTGTKKIDMKYYEPPKKIEEDVEYDYEDYENLFIN